MELVNLTEYLVKELLPEVEVKINKIQIIVKIKYFFFHFFPIFLFLRFLSFFCLFFFLKQVVIQK